MPASVALLRNEPVQARSTQRLTSLLDAAAASIDSHGFERLTTAMVAERAGASIGTVYRYFPDRISVLQAVAARAVTRFEERARDTLYSGNFSNWWQAMDALVDEGIHAFRNEPAFASLRFGDMLDLHPRENSETGSSRISRVISGFLATRFGYEDDQRLAFHLEVGFNIVDSLMHRAFMFDSSGDEEFLAQAKFALRNYLETKLGPVEG
ncbi:MAG: TetR family transcriptional regulator [Cryobacterium sp.]|nr:TetR family transcriptional regulator [Cryobacterium sp.]